ncbi:response regulator, partial [Caenispirillum bisanense]|uniref:response regulator n=1 Tax=Caenispirillum bisanense TaxID=414052 RepID=UPI0031DBF5BE
MAHTYFFSNVTAVLADEDRARLQVIRSTLHYLGFRDVTWGHSLGELRDLAESRRPDLIIASHDLPGGSTAQYLQQIRRGRTATDPFTPIIAVLSEASPDAVRRGIDSGADDLLIHPWPTGYLDGRLEKLIHGRKSFVVSADYVGPDRRAKARPGPQAAVLTPPNVLEAKALRRQPDEAVAAELAACRRALESHRLQALATLCVRLVEDVEAMNARQQLADPLAATQLRRLRAAAEDAARLAVQTPSAGAAIAFTFQDMARHAGLCGDALTCGRIASIGDLGQLRDTVAAAFRIETALLLDQPTEAAPGPATATTTVTP